MAILMCLNLHASPDMLNDADFVSNNQETISLATTIIEEHRYREEDGGVIIDDGVGQ